MIFGAGKGIFPKSTAKDAPPTLTRTSSGLNQFCSVLGAYQDLSILDMSGASQANISFVTGYGHRISSDDIIGTMGECFGKDLLEGQQAASNAQRFLDQSLTFPDNSFDGILVWDALQFLSSPLIEQAVAQLLRIMRSGGQMLVYFNSQEKAVRFPVYTYRIQDHRTVTQVARPGSTYQRSQYFNSRNLEQLFEHASSIKFFLTRDHLRELIIRK
ncbi:MAG: class I SAM-dependent methyltransferase [Acidobacteriaceae bacterium]|nr:class I SAM-dependent methyltransferase [Acidobacteriaceae bacterium]